MAGQSQASPSRREQREASEQRQRLIVIGVVAALVAVAVVITAGLYVTQYRAPRAHVLTIDGRDYDSSSVARRGAYFALFENGFRDQGTIALADTAVELLIDEAVLRAGAPEVVGAVGDVEVEGDLLERSGLTEDDGRAAFAELLQTRIQDSGLSRDEFYAVAAAGLLRSLMNDHFEQGIEPSAPQVKLSRIRLTSRTEAEEVRELSVDDTAFTVLVIERTVDAAHRGDGGDLGWLIVDTLEPEVAEAVADLEPGELTPVLEAGIFFDVYLVAEREDDRELSGAQIVDRVAEQFGAWLDDGRARVSVEVDLSGGESDWIGDRIVSDVTHSLGG